MIKMLKKTIVIGIVIIMLTVLSGCWDSVELDNRAIVTAVGIDITENGELEVTAQVINTVQVSTGPDPGQGGGGSSVVVHSITGRTVFEAIRALTKMITKKLYWEQNRIIVFSEKAARQGILPYVDFFMRDHEVRKRSWILVTDGQASEIIKAGSETANIPANDILDILDAQAATSEAAREDLYHLAIKLVSDTSCPVATHIGTHTHAEDDGGTEMPGEKKATILGTAAFRNDVFAGYLDNRESRGYHWITGDVKSGIIVVKSPGGDDADISIEIRKTSTNLRPQLENGVVSMKLSIETETSVGDVGGELDLSSVDTYDQLARSCEIAIAEEINACLAKAQKEYGTDIFAFGELVHHYLPQEWKKIKDIWLSELYQDVAVELDITVNVIHSGLITKPIRK